MQIIQTSTHRHGRRSTSFLLLLFFILVGCNGNSGLQLDPTSEAAIVMESTDDLEIDEKKQAPIIETGTSEPTEEVGTNISGTGNADVLFVEANLADDGLWRFAVTVEHEDTGWEDYADGWDVVMPDGTVVKPDPDSHFTRLLLHPHVGEQPFTRSQSGILIPPDVDVITVRAHDLVDGFGGQEVVVDLHAESGPDFKVAR